MSIKLYLHLDKSMYPELDQLHDYTYAYTVDLTTIQCNVQHIIDTFIQQYNARYTIKNYLYATYNVIGYFAFYIVHNNKKYIDPTYIINAHINDKDDIFVCINSTVIKEQYDRLIKQRQSNSNHNHNPTTAVTSTTTQSDKPISIQPIIDNKSMLVNGNTHEQPVKPSNRYDDITSEEALILSLLSQSRQYQDAGYLRKSYDNYQSIIHTIESMASLTSRMRSFKQIVYQQLGVIELYNKRYSNAIQYFTAALNISNTILQSSANNDIYELTDEEQSLLQQLPSLNNLLGQSLLGNKQYIQALKYFQSAQKLYEAQLTQFHDTKLIQLQQDIFDVRVYCARAMYGYSAHHLNSANKQSAHTREQIDKLMSYRQKSIDLYELLMKLDEHNVDLLVHYASIAVDVNQSHQAIPYLLRALVDAAQQESTGRVDESTKQYASQLLTNITKSQLGLQSLCNELQSSANTAIALGFLANILKQHGNIHGAIVLYQKAVQQLNIPVNDNKTNNVSSHNINTVQYKIDETEVNMTLNLCHTYEISYQYQCVFDTIKQWFAAHQHAKIGSYSCKPFYNAICNIHDIYDPTLMNCTNTNVSAWCEMCDIVDTDTLPTDGSTNTRMSNSTNNNMKDKSYWNSHELYNELPYSIDELNILGLIFTCVKVLYHTGAVQCIPAVVNLIEPLRKHKSLHMTVIRNEHAYYSTCIQLLHELCITRKWTTTNPPNIYHCISNLSTDVIYCIGDSHCLSLAWHNITIKNKQYLLIPKLVTGIKIYHLRHESSFYPKSNFYSMLSTIPSNSTCIVLMGEIDCRLGLQQSVDKYKYNTLHDAITYNIDIYANILKSIIKRKSMKLCLIHPVPPVLDISRNIVKQYNTVLQQSIATLQQSTQYNIHYMDIFHSLLSDNKNEFNSKYKLDNTHIHPSYITLIQDWCNDAIQQQKLTL